ncbi:unnamed protein product [Adineta steineri]|uniref:Uncharacterized protein n=1 Tax=Adineta steineri TaxID=433720 RepID=A0A819ER11_9BILA|nr:unnamed protein product [Adineta steineri]CAF3856001.1 unnamed protein product [Adineta steineri]
MYETNNLYSKSCCDYAQTNVRPLKPDEHFESIAPQIEVFVMVELDFWSPTSEQFASSNRYIIVLTNYLTKCVIAKAVPRNTVQITTEFTVETSLTTTELGPNLGSVVSSCSTVTQASTECSPSYLMFGRKIRLAFDSACPIVPIQKASDYLHHLDRYCRITLQVARVNIIQQQQLTKRR